jgi:23S rRNA (cytidine1920-2'-O)/16S rRNA (cytidine1409-2'-O)-methyltransferase
VKSFHRRAARPAPEPVARSVEPRDRGGRVRLDCLLVERGLAPSRAAAQRLVAAGHVRVAGEPVSRPAFAVPADAALSVVSD